MQLRLFTTVMTVALATLIDFNQANAQTGNVGIGTTTPVARLHVADSAVLFTGQQSSTPTDPPVSGAGLRMMWYPQKGAFRSGFVNGSQWDKGNIGYNSFSGGSNTIARGGCSVSFGAGTIAGANYSSAFGLNSGAIGIASTAMGQYINASGEASVSMGDGSIASGDFSLSVGKLSIASGKYSVSLGYNNTASGEASVSMGRGTTAIGSFSTSLGDQTKAVGSFSTSMGQFSRSIGSYSTAMGLNNVSYSNYALVTGLFNDTTLTNSLFEIGNGTANNARKNAMTVLANGNVGIGTSSVGVRLDVLGTNSWDLVNTEGDMRIGNSSHRLKMGVALDGGGIGAAGIMQAGGIGLLSIGAAGKFVMHINGTGNGNVGIGTSTPNALLQLGNTVANRKIVLYETANNDHQYYGFGINGGTLRYQTDAAAADHVFFAAVSSTSSQELMRIKGNGNVGIGTNAPSQKLHVIGNILASGTITPSDLRYKKDIELIDHPLDKIEEIRGVTYKLKTDEFPESGFTEEIQAGVIAQEVEAVLPQVVVTDQNGYKAVDYSKMVPLLIEGIKELKKQSEEYKKENAELKKRVRKLEKK
jgi:hypothetical protein